jgi:uncharacterized protein
MQKISIGCRLRDSRQRLAIAAALGAGTVLADLALVRWGYWDGGMGRGALAVFALAVYVFLVNGDLVSLGLVLVPTGGWRHWARVAMVIGLLVAGFIVVGLGTWIALGRELPLYTVRPSEVGAVFFRACVVAPIIEETTYRLAICIPAAILLRPWGAVVASGLAFATLHLVYGNPSPENLVGGFFLAWAYLKSGTILVPILFHSAGNLCAVATQIAAWYWVAQP